MFSYPAKIVPDGKGYLVTFRDIPEAMTGGATKAEALEMAVDALTTAMDFYFEDRRTVPEPSRLRRNEVGVELPASLAAKVLLLNEMVARKVTPSALAKKLHTSPQVVNRIVNLRHPTKIDTISEAISALGKRLILKVA